MTTSKRTLRGVMLGLALASVPMLVLATHTFSDVDDGAFYHDAVSNVAGAGVTAGCGSGTTFCPEDEVTRGQMATFLGRGLGRVAYAVNETPVVLGGGGVAVVSTVIEPGGAVAGTNMVSVTGTATVTCAAACTVGLALTDGTAASPTAMESLDAAGTLNVGLTWADEATTPGEATYSITAATIGGDGVTAVGDIAAVSLAFGHDGGNTLTPAP